jgi:hypothetical protein
VGLGNRLLHKFDARWWAVVGGIRCTRGPIMETGRMGPANTLEDELRSDICSLVRLPWVVVDGALITMREAKQPC